MFFALHQKITRPLAHNNYPLPLAFFGLSDGPMGGTIDSFPLPVILAR